MPFVDLSHAISHQMTTYPGLPGPTISSHLTFDDSAAVYAQGTEFAIGRIEMVANTGTYLDTPAHRYRDGHDLAGLPLERCAGLRALVLRVGGSSVPPTTAIDGERLTTALGSLPEREVAGAAVLLHTGWDAHWSTDRYGDPVHPHLTQDGADWLVQRRAALVGIDSVNIDDTVGGHRPAHTTLLAAGTPVVEHLTGLAALPGTGSVFTAVPPKVAGLATFPVRAFAVVP